MEPGSFGFSWKRKEQATPALLTAWLAIRRLRGTHMRLRHPAWVLDYEFSPGCLVRVASPSRRWEPRAGGTAHLYAPDTVYWEKYPRRAAPLHRSAYILFLGGEACGLSRLIDPRLRYGRFLDPDGRLGKRLEEIARSGHEEGETGFWRAQSLLCAVMDMLLRGAPAENRSRRIGVPHPVNEVSVFVKSANAYMDEHLADRIGLTSIARHLHISVSSLSHRYRNETGESPMGRVIRMRINLAKGMIVKGQPLKAVAEATGFSDAFHLSKTFKRMEGVPPRTYLRGLRR